MEPKYNEEGLLLDEAGEVIYDENENPITAETYDDYVAGLKKAEPPEKTPEELKAENEALKAERDTASKERDGFKNNLFSERERRRIAEETINKGGIGSLTKEELEEKRGEVMTRGEFEDEKSRLLVEIDNIQRRGAEKTSIISAKARHEDFDIVAGYALEELDKPENRHAKVGMDYADDYGEALYRFGKGTEKYIEKRVQAGSNKTVKTIKKNLEKAPTSAGKGGGAPPADNDELTLAELKKMTPAQRAALPESTRERLLGGEGEEE